MHTSPIYTSEPAVVRALATEIRQDSSSFLDLLHVWAGVSSFGELQQISCDREREQCLRLEFVTSEGEPYNVGVDGKFDQERDLQEIARQLTKLDYLFLLVTDASTVPAWVNENYTNVSIITWREALDCFEHPRITPEDLEALRN